GSNFFDNFTFWDKSDPTHGMFAVQTQNQSMNLTGVNNVGNAYIKVETTPVVSGNRSSVRIGTDNTFTKGIFVIDALHMPHGCGTWPAFWSTGPDWPTYGEIDIIEVSGWGEYTRNKASIHTAPGCSLPSNSSQVLGMEATLVGSTDCDARKTRDQGCGMRSNSNITFGLGFNSVGGGVYALVWSDKEIVVHFFPRDSIPQDLLSDSPTPDTWGTPMARLPSTDCDINKFFQNHTIIINTALCGGWVGGFWNRTGVAGQGASCAASTGYATCEDFTRNNGAAFRDAYWEIASMKIYKHVRNRSYSVFGSPVPHFQA
ncbi:glycoside hydrolase family 16 protein, partial [Fomitiporia mediterranea MF3/22]|uniref:glycoside hydrolase family 16 protein n=1 Tax=Fomitiporia mediterranea (strain MF3/22) TaxID=694068 RepID=UPI00044097AB